VTARGVLYEHGDPRAGHDSVVIRTVAIGDEGRRAADTPLVGELPGPAAVVALEHAGPVVSAWRSARALAPAAVPWPPTGRTPRGLDDEGWRDVEDRFAQAARTLVDGGAQRLLVRADDDGLLAQALSPLGNPEEDQAARLRRLVGVVTRVAAAGVPWGVALTVEELCPGGLDATGGIAAARACVEAGASLLIASGGSARFAPLMTRPDAATADDPWLASALWLRGRVDAPILARGPAADPGRALARANSLGLDGVVAVQPSAGGR
jgi:2,4-dienoyl-CoA reductase-like NADH-dependent reductase (Old Yellow Enzyme family)